MRTISSRNGMLALIVLFALVWVAEIARAQGGGDTATHEVGHWLAKYSVPPQIAPGMINDETVRFRIHVQLRIFADGGARGTLHLREVGGRRSFLFRVVGGKLIVDPQTGPKLELRLVHVGTNEESLGMIGRPTRPNAAGPRAIYTTHQGDLLCIFDFVDELVAN